MNARPGPDVSAHPAGRVVRLGPTEPGRLPFVFVNMAMTADGKIATANRRLASFGSAHDRAHLLELRATADAVMCGARTVEAGDILLGPGPARFRRLRLERGLAEYNLRVIVSGSGSVNPRAPVFTKRFSPIILLTSERASGRRLKRLEAVADQVVICGEQEVHFPSALAWLRRQCGVQRLLCEGGGELNAALFAAGLVDELHLTLCPIIFGGRDAPTIADGPGTPRLADAAQFQLKSVRRVADEFFVVLTRARRRASGASNR